MALHALENLDDAYAVTRDFLTGADRTTWVKLAVVVFFIGGPGANFNVFQYSFGGDGNGGAPPGGFPPVDPGPRVWVLVAAIVGVLLLAVLALALVGSIMEFVFLESLRGETVTIRRYWGRRWRQGLRLFGFRLAIGLLVLGTVLAFTLPFVVSQLDGGVPGPGFVLLLVAVLLPLFFVLAILVGLVNGFTTVFVVPIMILEDCGVLAGWRRLWSTIPRQWEQYLAYAVASFVLGIVGGIFVAVALGVTVVLLLVPFGVLFAIGIGALLVAEPLGIGLLVIVGLLFVATVFVVGALLQVPVQTYLRYYALLVLGDVDPELDLIPDQRAAVRESGSE